MTVRSIPGPDSYPVVGNLDLFTAPFDSYFRWQDRYGDVVAVDWLLADDGLVLVMHPDLVREVLHEKDDKFGKGAIQHESFAPVTGGDGLLLSEGKEWADRRSLSQPAFYPRRIQNYGGTVVNYTERLIREWTPGQRISINDQMRHITSQVLARCLFGVDIHEQDTVLGRASEAIIDKYDATSYNFALPQWVPTPINRRFASSVDDLNALIERFIAERRREDATHSDLLGMILSFETASKTTLDPSVIRDMLKGFLFGGLDTTPTLLTNVFHQLGENPRVRDELYAELDRELIGPPTPDKLGDLPYTEKVVTETLRYRPSVYTLFREATEPVEIGGYHIEAGKTLSLPQFVIHMDDRFYDDPAAFRPERWTGSFEDDLHECAYFPFGFGAEQCIGRRFAVMIAKLVVATVGREYHLPLESHEPVGRVAAITAQPDREIYARVSPRGGR